MGASTYTSVLVLIFPVFLIPLLFLNSRLSSLYGIQCEFSSFTPHRFIPTNVATLYADTTTIKEPCDCEADMTRPLSVYFLYLLYT